MSSIGMDGACLFSPSSASPLLPPTFLPFPLSSFPHGPVWVSSQHERLRMVALITWSLWRLGRQHEVLCVMFSDGVL